MLVFERGWWEMYMERVTYADDVDSVLGDTLDDALVKNVSFESIHVGKGAGDSRHRHMCPCDHMKDVSNAHREQLVEGEWLVS